MLKTVLDFFCHVSEVHEITGAGGTFNLKLVSIVQVEPLEGFDEKEVDSEPDRAPPIAVTTKKTTVGVARDVADLEALAVHIHRVRVVLVVF